MQLDYCNAFNSLSREAMLKAVAHMAPQLFKFANWMYKQPCPLRLAEAPPETAPLWSESGVRQGDPCGPLIFALGIQPVLESVQSWHPSVRVIAYLDDVILQGPKEAVSKAYMDLRDLAEGTELILQPTKSTVYSPTLSQAIALSNELSMKLSESGMIAAGCPVGEADFISRHADESAEKGTVPGPHPDGSQLASSGQVTAVEKVTSGEDGSSGPPCNVQAHCGSVPEIRACHHTSSVANHWQGRK
jgi:hypothetical protein